MITAKQSAPEAWRRQPFVHFSFSPHEILLPEPQSFPRSPSNHLALDELNSRSAMSRTEKIAASGGGPRN